MVRFEIPERECDYLQRLSFEKMAREEVVVRIIESHSGDADASVLDSAVFRHYMGALVEVTAEYETAKARLPELFPDGVPREAAWSLDFDSRIVTVDADA